MFLALGIGMAEEIFLKGIVCNLRRLPGQGRLPHSGRGLEQKSGGKGEAVWPLMTETPKTHLTYGRKST